MTRFKDRPHSLATVRNEERLYLLLRELLDDWIAGADRQIEEWRFAHLRHGDSMTAQNVQLWQDRAAALRFYREHLAGKLNRALGALKD